MSVDMLVGASFLLNAWHYLVWILHDVTITIVHPNAQRWICYFSSLEFSTFQVLMLLPKSQRFYSRANNLRYYSNIDNSAKVIR